MRVPDPTIKTIQQLLALPEDGRRHELLDGKQVLTPAPVPKHQLVLQEMYLVFGTSLARRDGLQVFLSPADVVLGPRSLMQPDLFVISTEPGRPIEAWSEVGIPLLALGVLSPTTAARDRGAKRKINQRAGIAEYWIVDPDARIVERWTPRDERLEIIDEIFEWNAPGEGRVTLDLPTVVRRALG